MKQAINTRTQEEYDALMRYLDGKKYKWDNGHSPMEKNYWGKRGIDCCVSIDQENELLRYGPVDWYKGINFQIIPFTEFAKANIEPDYKALYLEGRELLEKVLPYALEREDNFNDPSIADAQAYLTKHKDGV